MIGIAAKFAALDVLKKRLLASGDPNHVALGQLIDAHSGYAYFGALGTAYGDFSPVRVSSSGSTGTGTAGAQGTNAYVQIWKLILDVFGGDGSPDNPGLKPVLDTIRNLLSTLDDIAAREDLDGLKGMQSQVDTLNQIASNLSAIITKIKGDGTLANLGIVPQVTDLISNASRPAIVRPRPGGGVGFPPRFWTLREILAWRRTGRFAQLLWDRADASHQAELRAYALGWLSSWALCSCGASAVASIIGAPYRNQWWRARFVSNYIDLWSYGYAEIGVEPPPYNGWPNLCDQELQKRIEIPGVSFKPDDLMTNLRLGNGLSAALPDTFVNFWNGCYDDVYGDLGANRPKVDADSLQDAYAMAWLVLWFQSSTQSLGCNAVMPTAPTNCGGAPSWTDPTVPADAGGGAGGPPPPDIDKTIDTPNLVCAIILAALGIVALCMGGFVAGGAAIGAAIGVAAAGGNIDWDKFRCDLAWYHLYLYNGLRALHDVLSLGALVHPYTLELSQDATVVSLLKDLSPTFETGDHIVKSRVRERYPVQPWDGSGYTWFNDPMDPIEELATTPALASAYPSGFIDDPANPLGSRSPFDPAPWPFALDSSGRPLGFINAIDALLTWLPTANQKLPDWNLDGDRGLGFHTWQFVSDTWTNPVNIQQEP